MKFLIPVSFLVAGAFAQDGCGFPDGPDCVSLGEGANGLEQFADDGCCLLPIRCGNGDGGERCERVAVAGNNNAGGAGNGGDAGNAGNAGNDNAGDAGNNDAGNAGNAADDTAADDTAADTTNDENCGFPNGPDCESLGEGANGLEQFADDGCCLLPFRCGNGDGGERCERVPVANKRARSLPVLRTRAQKPKKPLRVRDREPKMAVRVRDDKPKEALRVRDPGPKMPVRPRFHGPRHA